VRPECKIKEGNAIVEIQSQNVVEVKSESMGVKEDPLEMLNVEQKNQ